MGDDIFVEITAQELHDKFTTVAAFPNKSIGDIAVSLAFSQMAQTLAKLEPRRNLYISMSIYTGLLNAIAKHSAENN